MTTTFKIGDTVKIIDKNEAYTHYTDLAIALNLSGFTKGNSPDASTPYKIIRKTKRPKTYKTVYAIESETGEQFLINAEGITPIEKCIKKETKIKETPGNYIKQKTKDLARSIKEQIDNFNEETGMCICSVTYNSFKCEELRIILQKITQAYSTL